MKTEFCRLTFQRLIYGAQLHKLAIYLQNNLGLQGKEVRDIMASPPRVVLDHFSQPEAVRDRIIDKTDSIDGFATLVPLPLQKLKGKEDPIQLYSIEIAL